MTRVGVIYQPSPGCESIKCRRVRSRIGSAALITAATKVLGRATVSTSVSHAISPRAGQRLILNNTILLLLVCVRARCYCYKYTRAYGSKCNTPTAPEYKRNNSATTALNNKSHVVSSSGRLRTYNISWNEYDIYTYI